MLQTRLLLPEHLLDAYKEGVHAALAGVTIGLSARERICAAVRTCVFCLEHSGQRMPTGVGVMQSGQIGRPQDEQDTPVTRFGCR